GNILITDADVTSGKTDDYIFTWYRDDAATVALVDINGDQIETPCLDNTNYPTMGEGSYFVTITTISGAGMGCESAAIEIEVGDTSVDPVIDFTATANTSCDLDQADGSLRATATT